MQLPSILTRPLGTSAVFTCALLASLAFAATQQAAASSASTPVISAGEGHTCGVTSSGEGLCWGKDEKGETAVPTGKMWASIDASGKKLSCGVTTTGEGFCWGDNWGGAADVPTGRIWASITSRNSLTCGVTNSGEGLCWGANREGEGTVPQGKTWASITAGKDIACGVTTIGEGLCWGANGFGQRVVPNGHNWSAISPSDGFTCGVTTIGEGFCWGYSAQRRTALPDGKTWASIDTGTRHSCGVTTAGEGFCWGGDNSGDTNVPTGKTWASITAGDNHTCGLTKAGEGLCWGYDGYEAPYGYDYENNGDFTGPYDYYYAAVPADGRLIVPAGKFDVDSTAPAAPVLSGAPSGLSNLTTASISFGGEVGATFTCSLDDSVFADCGDYGGSPASLSGLSDGEHTFQVKATDGAGNTSEAASATWTVDATPPAVPSLSGVPAATTKLTTASIGINGEANATFLCSVDGGSYSFCASPLGLTKLSPGEHVVLVKQTDEAGNSSTLATASWAVLSPGIPRLRSKVGLKFNFKTRVSTLTLNAVADTEGGPNAIKWIEYANHWMRPSPNALQSPSRIRAYAPTISLRPGEVAFWVRVKDTKNNWSGWYRTRFKPGGIGW